MIAIALSKHQTLDADPKATQQINFTENLNQSEDVNNNNTRMFFIIEDAKESFRFFTKNCKRIVILFCFNIISI